MEHENPDSGLHIPPDERRGRAREEQSRSKRPALFGVLIGCFVLSVILAVVFYLDIGGGGGAPVILKADDTGAIRTRPDDPGGAQLDNLGSAALDLVEDGTDEVAEAAVGREILTPPEETPEPPPISIAAPPQEPQAESPAQAQTQDAPSPSPSPESAEGETATATTTESGIRKIIIDPAATPSPSQNTGGGVAAPPPPPRLASANSGGGSSAPQQQVAIDPDNAFYVQFAAFRKEDSANRQAAVLAEKHRARLGTTAITLIRYGAFWRVATEPMSRDNAQLLCRQFRAVGQDCVVKLLEVVK